MKKLVIWFIGGNSVGKTTNARLFHEYFAKLAGEEPNPVLITRQINGNKTKITQFSSYSCNLGDLTTNACGGTDTLNSKELITESFREALRLCPVVIVEGIMATGQWVNFLKTDETLVYLVYLKMTPDLNLKLLTKRRAEKKGIRKEEVEITDKTRENMLGKLKGFESLYNRMKGLVDYRIQVDVDNVLVFDVFDTIRMNLERNLLKMN